MNKNSKIIALTVCVNYDDFLSLIVEQNKLFLKDWYIVTDIDDLKTQELCKTHDLKCVVCSGWRDEENDTVNKPTYLNTGLKKIFEEKDEDDWVLNLDSDIILTEGVMNYFKKRIDANTLNPLELHTTPRLFIDEKETYEELVEHNFSLEKLTELYKYEDIYLDEYESRGAGYFQLFKKEMYYNTEKLNDYKPEDREVVHALLANDWDNPIIPSGYVFPTGDLADIDFAKKFDNIRVGRYYVYHLGEAMVNWSDRITERWT